MSDFWKTKKRPPSLEARFEFNDYDSMRDFLDEVADVAEAKDHHPNISFSRSHASLVIYPKDGDKLSDFDFELSEAISECFNNVLSQS